MRTTLVTGETLLNEGPANHFKNGEAVGGHFYLTTHRLIFESHAVNFQPHDVFYYRRDIIGGKKVGVLTKVELSMRDGSKEQFVVFKREQWLADLLQGI